MFSLPKALGEATRSRRPSPSTSTAYEQRKVVDANGCSVAFDGIIGITFGGVVKHAACVVDVLHVVAGNIAHEQIFIAIAVAIETHETGTGVVGFTVACEGGHGFGGAAHTLVKLTVQLPSEMRPQQGSVISNTRLSAFRLFSTAMFL